MSVKRQTALEAGVGKRYRKQCFLRQIRAKSDFRNKCFAFSSIENVTRNVKPPDVIFSIVI